MASAALKDHAGSSAIEFALLGPVLIVLLMAIVAYGGYFLMAHAVQQLSNDAARATVGGLSDTERRTLAASCLASELPSYGFLNPQAAQLSITDQATVLTVQLSYDASSSPIWSLRGLVPLPSSLIVRTAAIQLGGY